MQESIFTKIINGEIPSYKVYEDAKVFAFLDIHPVQPGHTLVIPKVQVPFVWDLPPDDYGMLMNALKVIAQHIRSVLKVPYVGSQIVGVDVPHAHIHLIPFSTMEEFRRHPNMSASPDHASLHEISQRLSIPVQ